MKQEKRCNMCGKKIVEKQEDCLDVQKEWGYFSRRDLEVHEFNLCEECYEKLTQGFVIPVSISKKLEVLDEEKSFS